MFGGLRVGWPSTSRSFCSSSHTEVQRSCVAWRTGTEKSSGLCKRHKAARAAAHVERERTERELDRETFATGRKVISRVGRKSGRVYPLGRFQDRQRTTRKPTRVHSFFRIRPTVVDKLGRASTCSVASSFQKQRVLSLLRLSVFEIPLGQANPPEEGASSLTTESHESAVWNRVRNFVENYQLAGIDRAGNYRFFESLPRAILPPLYFKG